MAILLGVLLQDFRAFEGGEVAGSIRVEAQDHALGDPLEQFGMAIGEGGADRADHVALPCLVRHDHVHVALDYHHLPGALYVRAGQVEAVEDGAFVEYSRLGRVEILGRLPVARGRAHRSRPPRLLRRGWGRGRRLRKRS